MFGWGILTSLDWKHVLCELVLMKANCGHITVKVWRAASFHQLILWLMPTTVVKHISKLLESMSHFQPAQSIRA